MNKKIMAVIISVLVVLVVAVVIIVYAVTGFKFGCYTGQVFVSDNMPMANISVT